MKIYINYADKNFRIEQNFATTMAKYIGKFDKIKAYTRNDIDKHFYEKNRHILDAERGGGYWLWKPYIIYKTLTEIDEQDFLFYSDSGLFFLKQVDILIKELEKTNQDIMGFELPLIEKQWTKKELFINMNCDDEYIRDSNQIMASYILIRKTKFSMKFFDDFLKFAQNEINITDKQNKNIKENDDFIEHRHDQSIFSLLYKKNKLIPFKDATQMRDFPMSYSGCSISNIEHNILCKMPNGRLYRVYDYKEKYKKVLFHNRKGHPILSVFKFYIRRVVKFLKYL